MMWNTGARTSGGTCGDVVLHGKLYDVEQVGDIKI